MATASQLNILLTDGTTTVVVPIAAAVQSLDAAQAGYFAPDVAVANIMRRRGFWDSTNEIFRPISQIKSISWQ